MKPSSITNPIFSAASSTSSLFTGLHTEHQQPSSFNMTPFYDIPTAQNVTIDSMLNNELSDELDKVLSSSLSNASATGVDNHLDVSNNAINSYNSVLRRGSLINECSAPINIPRMLFLLFKLNSIKSILFNEILAGRISSHLNDMRSTSATGFNHSPPTNVSQLNTTSPLGSSFGLAATFPTNGRQFSTPQNNSNNGSNNGQQGLLFEQFNSNVAANAIAKQNLAFFEIHRLRDELTNLKKAYDERCTQLVQVSMLQC